MPSYGNVISTDMIKNIFSSRKLKKRRGKTMNKIKRNKKVEKSIIYRVRLLENESFTPEEFTDIFIEKYKRNNKDNNIFTADETDTIMQLLKSMPGYTPEKLYTLLRMLHKFGDNFEETLGFQLYVAYIMISITNPELFEEENND